MPRNSTRAITKVLDELEIGRVFRWLGLPLRTFLGIGIASWWLSSFAELLKLGIQQLLDIGGKSVEWRQYLPPLIVFLIPFVVVLLVSLRYKSSSKPRSRLGAGLQKPEGKKGLILLVSNEASAKFAIKYHLLRGKLEIVWLIPSKKISNKPEFGEGTEEMANKIKEGVREQLKADAEIIAESKNLPAIGCCLEKLNMKTVPPVSPVDSQETFDRVNRIYRDSIFDPSEIIADFTGGTKPMSVGMIMACLPSERELEYVAYDVSTKTSHGPYVLDYQHKAFGLIG